MNYWRATARYQYDPPRVSAPSLGTSPGTSLSGSGDSAAVPLALLRSGLGFASALATQRSWHYLTMQFRGAKPGSLLEIDRIARNPLHCEMRVGERIINPLASTALS